MFSSAEKRFLSFFLSFLMLFSCFPAEAIAEVMDGTGSQEQVAEPAVPVEEDETPVLIAAGTIEQTATAADDGMTPEELAAGYAQQQLEAALPESARSSEGGLAPMAARPAREALSGYELAAYDALKPMIKAVAAGDQPSSVFVIPVEQIYGKTRWTAEDLGVSTLFLVDGEGEYVLDDENRLQLDPAAEEAFENAVSINFEKVLSALLADCPYDLYWFDKAAGFKPEYELTGTRESGEWALCFSNNQRIFKFTVGSSYATGEYEVDPSTGTRVTAAIEEAQRVVNQNTGTTPYEKLVYFKDYICGEVTYDHAAADAGSSTGNDPWQLISVFDKDTSTNVVCEGYSKAFKYLCDLADIEGVGCILASGTKQGEDAEGAGNHMWNIVNMDDGRNYLVDITNSEPDTAGYPDGLFIAVPDSGSMSDGYSFLGNTISYNYDEDTRSVYAERDLMLSDTPYEQAGADVPEGGRYFTDYNGQAHLYYPLTISADEGLAVQPSYTGAPGDSFIYEEDQLWILADDEHQDRYMYVAATGGNNVDLESFAVLVGDEEHKPSYSYCAYGDLEIDGQMVETYFLVYDLSGLCNAPVEVRASAVDLSGPVTIIDENGVEHVCYPADFSPAEGRGAQLYYRDVVHVSGDAAWADSDLSNTETRLFARRNSLSNDAEQYFYDPSLGFRFSVSSPDSMSEVVGVTYSLDGGEPVELTFGYDEMNYFDYYAVPALGEGSGGPIAIDVSVVSGYTIVDGVLTPDDESLGQAYHLAFESDSDIYFGEIIPATPDDMYQFVGQDDGTSNTSGSAFYLWDGSSYEIRLQAYDGISVDSISLDPENAGSVELLADGVTVRLALSAPAKLVAAGRSENVIRGGDFELRFDDAAWAQTNGCSLSAWSVEDDAPAADEALQGVEGIDYRYARATLLRPSIWGNDSWESGEDLNSVPTTFSYTVARPEDAENLSLYEFDPETGAITKLDATVEFLYEGVVYGEQMNYYRFTVDATLGQLDGKDIMLVTCDPDKRPVQLVSAPWSISSDDVSLMPLFADVSYMQVGQQSYGRYESIDGQDVYVEFSNFTFYDDWGGSVDFTGSDAEVTLSYDLTYAPGERPDDLQACFMMIDDEYSEATRLDGVMVYDENGTPVAYRATVSPSTLTSKYVGIAIYEPTDWLSVNGYTLVPAAGDEDLFNGCQLWYSNPGDFEGYWDNYDQINSGIADAMGFDAYLLTSDVAHLSLCVAGSEGSEAIDIDTAGMADLPVTLRVQLPYSPDEIEFFHFTQVYSDVVKLESTAAPVDGEDGSYSYEISGSLKDVLGFVKWVSATKVGDPYVSDGITYHAIEFTSGAGAYPQSFQDDSEPYNRYIYTRTMRGEDMQLADASRGAEFYIEHFNPDWEIDRVTITVGGQTRELEPTGEKRAAWEGDTNLYDVYATGPLADDVTISVETVPTFTIENGVLTDKDGNKAYKLDFSADNEGITLSHIGIQDMTQRPPRQIENPEGGYDYYLWENGSAFAYLTEASGASIKSAAISPASAGTAELLPEKNRVLVTISAPATLEIETEPANQLVAMERTPSGELYDMFYKLTFDDAAWNQVRSYDLRGRSSDSPDSEIQNAVRDALRELGLSGYHARYFYAAQNEEEVDIVSAGIADVPATAVFTLELPQDFDTSIISLYHYDPDTGELKKMPTTLTKIREAERNEGPDGSFTTYIYEVAATGTFGDLTGYITYSNGVANKITRIDLTDVAFALGEGDEMPFGTAVSDVSARYFIPTMGWYDRTADAYYSNGSSDSPLVEKDHEYQLQICVAAEYYSDYFAIPSEISVYVDGEPCENVDVSIEGRGAVMLNFAPIMAVPEDERVDIAGAVVSPVASQVYTGSEIKPELEVTYNGSALIKNLDYGASYVNNVNAGTASVTITGIGRYKGTKPTTFTINSASISSASVSPIPDQAYDGSAKTPAVTVKLGNKTLKAGTDYTVKYDKNTNAGTATVTVTGKGNYSGTASGSFKIAAADISKAKATAPNQTYDGSAKTPAVSVTLGGKTLKAGTDYTVSYKNNVNPGTATFTVSGKGNYKGSVGGSFTIAAAQMSGATVSPIAAQTHTGKAITPAVTVTLGGKTLKAGTDYTVSYKDNVNPGTATVTVTGKGGYAGTKSATFKIAEPAKTPLSSATIAAVPTQAFTGSAVEPALTVKLGPATLKAGTDYTVSYKSNVMPGTATATVTGRGAYTGTKSVTFKIAEPFRDVNVKTPHYEDILWLYGAKVTQGWELAGGVREFRPYGNVARCDMAAFLYRLAGSPAYTPTARDKAYFSDVNDKTPHAKEIWWLASKGISRGWDERNGTHTFRPYLSVARCDMAAFLYRLAGSPEYTPSAAEKAYFSDINASSPHANEVWWLASKGISAGWTERNGSHTFRPYVKVARCDMAAFLHRMDNGGMVPQTR